jgi:hypothetical protein
MAYSIYAGLTDAEQALTYFEKAADVRGMSGLLVNADPRYERPAVLAGRDSSGVADGRTAPAEILEFMKDRLATLAR